MDVAIPCSINLRDGDASAQASVSNVNGNNATTTHAYSVDASAPTVAINTIAGDEKRQTGSDRSGGLLLPEPVLFSGKIIQLYMFYTKNSFNFCV